MVLLVDLQENILWRVMYTMTCSITGESCMSLQDMLAGWLQQVDQVLSTGVPTWKRLVEALKDQTVGQNGLAIKTEKKQLLG